VKGIAEERYRISCEVPIGEEVTAFSAEDSDSISHKETTSVQFEAIRAQQGNSNL
jgi:hypothetical protein